MNRIAAVLLATAVGLSVASPAGAQALPVWEEAAKTWEAAMSQYRKELYDQAQLLLEEFVKKYPHNEYVAGAYLEMANCRLRRQDRAGWEKALDEVIKRFPVAGAWFIAHANRLAWLHSQKKNDEYLELLESMLRKCKEIPFDLTGISHDHPRIWYRYNSRGRTPGTLPWIWEPLDTRGMEHQLLAMCDTPQRAERALRALGATFKARAREMPPEWEFTHYALLKKAGKDRDADKALKDYQDGWAGDPRGIGLWVLTGEYAQDANDDKAADAAYEQLMKSYAPYGSLSYYLGPRLEYLKNRGRYEDFVATAEFYLQRFPRGHFRDDLFEGWLAMLRPKAVAGGADAYQQAVKVLAQYQGADSYYTIKWLVSLNLDRKKPEEALPLASRLLGEAYWSGETFKLLEGYAAKDASLAKLVTEARAKYGVPVPDPNAPAAALVKDLEARIADQQERHMEEIGEKLISEHPKDPATIEAVAKLAEYYFNKLMPEPRDKWAGRMMASYPKHPLTQQVMIRQAIALQAAKKYDELAGMLDALRERFPTAYYRDWMDHRLECFRAAKDVAGKAAFARKRFGPAADAGDLKAIEELAQHELEVLGTDTQRIGDYWTDRARKLTDPYARLYCLYRAIDGYCLLWTPDWLRDRYRTNKEREFLWDRGMDAVRTAQAHKEDPEFAWYLEHANIKLLAEKGDGRRTMDAMKEQLKGPHRDLSARLDLVRITRALGEPNSLTQEALVFGQSLERSCHTLRDRNAVNSYMGGLYRSLGMYPQALQHFAAIIDECPWPAKVFGAFDAAVNCTRGNAAQANALAQSYLAKIHNVQDVAPRVWYALAYAFNRNPAALASFGGQLVQRYPDSMARGQLVRLTTPQPPGR